MPVYPYNEVRPRLGERVFIAPGAVIAGDVETGADCSFWFHTVRLKDEYLEMLRLQSREVR